MLRIHPTPPFRLDLTLQPLVRQSDNCLDRWDGKTFRRVFIRKNRPAELSIHQEGPPGDPILIMDVRGLSLGAENKVALLPTLSHMLGLGLQLETFTKMASRDPLLARLLEGAEGLKPSRFATAFEALVNAFSHSRNSDALACVNHFTLSHGATFEGRPAFPRPQDIAPKTVEAITQSGFTTAQASAIHAMASSLTEGKLDFKSWHEESNATVMERLVSMPGISRSIAEYVALMGLGRIDVFPTHDPAVLDALGHWLGLAATPILDEVPSLLSRWTPWRGMIYFHLLRQIQSKT
jgi:DNA-3-methyladenine glycosylase II